MNNQQHQDERQKTHAKILGESREIMCKKHQANVNGDSMLKTTLCKTIKQKNRMQVHPVFISIVLFLTFCNRSRDHPTKGQLHPHLTALQGVAVAVVAVVVAVGHRQQKMLLPTKG
ncbi:MAG: hypothetical protein U0T84_09515 [Chitinophagales bacterium]